MPPNMQKQLLFNRGDIEAIQRAEAIHHYSIAQKFSIDGSNFQTFGVIIKHDVSDGKIAWQ